MIKVEIYEQKFIVHDKTTICIVRTESIGNILYKLGMDGNIKALRKYMKLENIWSNDLVFKGVAVCAPNDEYCELMGKDIAENKAHREMNAYIKALIAACINVATDDMLNLKLNYSKYNHLSKRATENIQNSRKPGAIEHYKKIEKARAMKAAAKNPSIN